MQTRLRDRSRHFRALWTLPLVATLALGIGCGSDDDGGSGPAAPTPIIDGIADASGGATVIGDVMRVTGENLDGVTVAVGGVDAPVLDGDATTLRFQIPAGAPVGTVVVRISNGSNSDTLPVNVTRYAVVASIRDGGSLDVIDTADFSVVTTVTSAASSSNWPRVMGFVSNGSLVLVPTGQDRVTWIDLTATPPSGGDITITDAVQILGIAVSPDETRAAVADKNGDFVHSLSITESLPPYTAPITAGTSTPLPGGPRAPRFLDDDNVLIMLQSEDAIARLERAPLQFTDTTDRFDTGGADYPLQSELSANGELFVATFSNAGVRRYTVSGTSVAYVDSIPSSLAISTGMDRSGERLFFAASTGGSIQCWDVSGAAPSQLGSVNPGASASLDTMGVDPYGTWILWSNGNGAGVIDVAPDGSLTERVSNPLVNPTDQAAARFVGVQP